MKKNAVVFGFLCCLFFSPYSIGSVENTVEKVSSSDEGFYVHQFGKYKIIALKDGSLNLAPVLFNKNLTAVELLSLFKKLDIDQTEAMQTSVNAFLIDDGERNLTLIDSGAASCAGEGLGSISQNIQNAGYSLARVKTVFLTHLHPDHVCGVSKDGKRVFPNATIYVSDKEDAYWLGNTNISELKPSKQKAYLETVEKIKKAVEPYKAIKNYKTFKDGTTINGIDVMSSLGHTPGHYSFILKDGDKQIVFIGDIVHSHKLQFDQPKLAVEFDVDPVQASETRIEWFKELENNKSLVAAPHLPFPGLGHIYKFEANNYQWVALGASPEVFQPKKVDKSDKTKVDTVINAYPGNRFVIQKNEDK